MGKKIPRDPFVRASFERRNNLGKGKAILSEKDRLKQNRHARKAAFLKQIERSGCDDGSFFYIFSPVAMHCNASQCIAI